MVEIGATFVHLWHAWSRPLAKGRLLAVRAYHANYHAISRKSHAFQRVVPEWRL